MISPGVIGKDRWDRRQYAALRDQSPILSNLEERLREHIPGPLVEDTWAALFKVRPTLLDQEEVQPQELLLHQVMQSLMDTPEYHETRQWTRLDEWASALGAAHLGRKVEEWLQEWQKQQAQGGGAVAGGQTPGEPPQVTGQPGQSGGQPRAQANAAAGGQQAGGQQAGALPATAFRALQQRLREGLSELSGVGGLLWGTGPGQARRVDGRQVELADKLLRDEVFRRMARMAGRMYTASLARKLSRGRDGVVPAGITLGSDLGRVLPEELVALRHPVLRRDFLLRCAEGRLRQLEVRGAQQERGPIVCCVDTSGSMQGAKYEWAKAVALALLRVARRERRSFSGILFSSTATGPFRLAPSGTPEDIEAFTRVYLGGGTNFWPPLQLALQEIGQQRRADVVFITDGYAQVEPWLVEFNQCKRRLGFRVFGVFVPHDTNKRGEEGLKTLRKFSDEVLVVHPAPDGSGLELLFDQV